MSSSMRSVYQTIVNAAIESTGAERGWLLGVDGETLTVLAAGGGPSPEQRVGQQREAIGTTGYVVASGQAAALQPRSDDVSNTGVGGADGVPGSILSTACGHTEVNGVLELVDSAAGSFTFDDVEIAGLVAEIAGSVIAEADSAARPVTPPAQVANDLANLAVADPQRYADTVRLIEALLG